MTAEFVAAFCGCASLSRLAPHTAVILRCSSFFRGGLEGWATRAAPVAILRDAAPGRGPQDDGGVCGGGLWLRFFEPARPTHRRHPEVLALQGEPRRMGHTRG